MDQGFSQLKETKGSFFEALLENELKMNQISQSLKLKDRYFQVIENSNQVGARDDDIKFLFDFVQRGDESAAHKKHL